MLVDIPKDVTQAKAEFAYPKTITLRSYNPVTKGHAGQIKKAVQLLLDAKRPMVYTGGGVILNNAAPQLTRLVRLLGFPCTNTLMGLGGFPGTDPQFTGMLGMHGTYESNMAMQHCDVLIAIGARFDDRVIGNPGALLPRRPQDHPHRHRSVVDLEAGQGRRADRRLRRRRAGRDDQADRVVAAAARPGALKAWWAEIKDWQRKDCLRYDTKSPLIKPQYVMQKLYELTKGDAFVTSDVGQHQMWVAQYYKFDKPRRWINSGGLGTMGFGLPAAMGVQARQSGCDRGLRHRRSVDPDVHPGALDLQAVPSPDQGREPEQPVHGDGPAVAGVLLR